MRLYSWNVNGLRAAVKKDFCAWLADTRPDILGLQESKLQAHQIPPPLCADALEDYTAYWSHAERPGYSGVSVFTLQKPQTFTEGLGIKHALHNFDNEGRVLRLDFERFTYFNIYYPNGGSGDARLAYKLAFYEAFQDLVCRLKAEGRSLVICGDVNTAHRAIDLARPKENETVSGFLPEERAWLDRFTAAGFVDTFRHLYPEKVEYSWWNMRMQARERNVGWRIDYFFVSDDLVPNIVDAAIHTDVMGSDHCPVSLTLAL